MSRHELPFGGGGRPPLARPCPRCGRVIGMSYGRDRYQQARHKNLAGRKCLEVREAETGRVVG